MLTAPICCQASHTGRMGLLHCAFAADLPAGTASNILVKLVVVMLAEWGLAAGVCLPPRHVQAAHATLVCAAPPASHRPPCPAGPGPVYQRSVLEATVAAVAGGQQPRRHSPHAPHLLTGPSQSAAAVSVTVTDVTWGAAHPPMGTPPSQDRMRRIVKCAFNWSLFCSAMGGSHACHSMMQDPPAARMPLRGAIVLFLGKHAGWQC